MDFANGNGGRHIAVDMEQLISSYRSCHPRESKGFNMSRKSCIFRIPNILSRHNTKAYFPNAFSFGPWHHGKSNLKFAQALKINYLKDLLSRFEDPNAKLLELEVALTEMKKEARQCYAEQVGFNDDEFMRILLLDSCFIIELFLKNDGVVSRDPDDPIFGMACMLQYLNHDLILLENQIPWFVLKRIFDLTTESIRQLADIELHQLAIKFFGNILTGENLTMENLDSNKIKHIIDLLRKYCFFVPSEQLGRKTSSTHQPKSEPVENRDTNYLLPEDSQFRPSEQQRRETSSTHQRESERQLPSASRLREAGIKFERSSSRSKGIFDIKFREVDGVLEVPSLFIHYTTETIFRNLIAYEQCCYGLQTIVTSYAKLMDNLIDKVDDLHILTKNRIILNSLSSEDATQLFNKLYNDTRITQSHYSGIYKDVYGYYEKRWPRWRAAYIQNYFTKPWAIVSQLFALVILTLTIIQVVLAFKQNK